VAGENGIPPKPDPAPFRMCLETLGVAAGDAVYVGDDWRIDVCGSRDAGLNPVWLNMKASSATGRCACRCTGDHAVGAALRLDLLQT